MAWAVGGCSEPFRAVLGCTWGSMSLLGCLTVYGAVNARKLSEILGDGFGC